MDLKIERQKNIYKQVNELYVNKAYTIDKACKKIGICKATYYKIKKNLNSPTKDDKPSQLGGVNKEINIDNAEKKSHVKNIFDDIDSKLTKKNIQIEYNRTEL